ncbi:MAG TPA: deoxyribonuclease IV [Candidatus Polarisedimenticolaceae bacterium]|nr:deoxyribonuclease IV [Candidatus Polarisedimenticolaceae bacterium]
MNYGLHISTAGKLATTPQRAKAMTADALQIFAGSPRSFKQPVYTAELTAGFKQSCIDLGMPAFIHMLYLTSYGSPDDTLRQASIDAAQQTMRNADLLGVNGVVTHLGSHKGKGTAAVMDHLRDALLEVISVADTKLLLENSAGAGGNVGNSIDELAQIYEAVGRTPKIGFCLDTAHLFASGYEVRTEAGWKAVLDEFDAKIGLDNLGCVHLNDSKVDLGSKRDRHENIGQGLIGEAGFKVILNEPRMKNLTGLLEVPGLDDKGPDKANLDKLRELTSATT